MKLRSSVTELPIQRYGDTPAHCAPYIKYSVHQKDQALEECETLQSVPEWLDPYSLVGWTENGNSIIDGERTGFATILIDLCNIFSVCEHSMYRADTVDFICGPFIDMVKSDKLMFKDFIFFLSYAKYCQLFKDASIRKFFHEAERKYSAKIHIVANNSTFDSEMTDFGMSVVNSMRPIDKLYLGSSDRDVTMLAHYAASMGMRSEIFYHPSSIALEPLTKMLTTGADKSYISSRVEFSDIRACWFAAAFARYYYTIETDPETLSFKKCSILTKAWQLKLDQWLKTSHFSNEFARQMVRYGREDEFFFDPKNYLLDFRTHALNPVSESMVTSRIRAALRRPQRVLLHPNPNHGIVAADDFEVEEATVVVAENRAHLTSILAPTDVEDSSHALDDGMRAGSLRVVTKSSKKRSGDHSAKLKKEKKEMEARDRAAMAESCERNRKAKMQLKEEEETLRLMSREQAVETKIRQEKEALERKKKARVEDVEKFTDLFYIASTKGQKARRLRLSDESFISLITTEIANNTSFDFSFVKVPYTLEQLRKMLTAVSEYETPINSDDEEIVITQSSKEEVDQAERDMDGDLKYYERKYLDAVADLQSDDGLGFARPNRESVVEPFEVTSIEKDGTITRLEREKVVEPESLVDRDEESDSEPEGSVVSATNTIGRDSSRIRVKLTEPESKKPVLPPYTTDRSESERNITEGVDVEIVDQIESFITKNGRFGNVGDSATTTKRTKFYVPTSQYGKNVVETWLELSEQQDSLLADRVLVNPAFTGPKIAAKVRPATEGDWSKHSELTRMYFTPREADFISNGLNTARNRATGAKRRAIRGIFDKLADEDGSINSLMDLIRKQFSVEVPTDLFFKLQSNAMTFLL